MNTKNQSANASRAYKKAQFAEPAQSKGKLLLTLILVGIVALAGYLIMRSSGSSPSVAPAAAVQRSANTSEIRIPLTDLEGGQAKFFDHQLSSGKTVRFFAVKDAAGVYRAALDACEVCFHVKQGYYQEGDQMVCRKCGRKFAVDRIGTVKSGCHPIGVARTVEGHHLVIKTSELEGGAEYF